MAARLVGWIGPVVYLLAVLSAALLWLAAGVPCPDGHAAWGLGASGGAFAAGVGTGTTGEGLSVVTTAAFSPLVGGPGTGIASGPDGPLLSRPGFWFGLTSCLLTLSWLLAMAWSAWQARHKTPDPDEDGLWSAHILNVAFASRLALLPLNVTFFLTALHATLRLARGGALSGDGAALGVATVALTGMMVALPAATYHLCASVRLSARGLLSGRAATCQALLAIFPLAGFVSLCWLQATGHAALRAAHDTSVASRALRAYREGMHAQEATPAPSPAPTTSPSSTSSTAEGTPSPR